MTCASPQLSPSLEALTEPATRPRGRPPKTDPPESPAARVARLQSELEAAQAIVRAVEARQAAIIGAAVLGHMTKDADFRRQISALVRSSVKRKDDLAAVASLLSEG